MKEFFTPDNLRLIVAVASLAFALWQYLQKRRMKKLIAFEAVELHKNVAVALGATDAAITAIANGNSGIGEVGRAQGLCQAILFESAKLFCNLKDTKLDDIDDLISNNQLAENYRHIYYSFSNPRRGYLSKFIKWVSKLF
jgi:formate hydrogenlyase subunit 3/multisubunit Na+/H+ antiporter MnhD subunit